MGQKLTAEQVAIIDAQMAADGSFTPPDDATDAEIDSAWSEFEDERRAWFTAQLLYPDLEPSRALALLK